MPGVKCRVPGSGGSPAAMRRAMSSSQFRAAGSSFASSRTQAIFGVTASAKAGFSPCSGTAIRAQSAPLTRRASSPMRAADSAPVPLARAAMRVVFLASPQLWLPKSYTALPSGRLASTGPSSLPVASSTATTRNSFCAMVWAAAWGRPRPSRPKQAALSSFSSSSAHWAARSRSSGLWLRARTHTACSPPCSSRRRPGQPWAAASRRMRTSAACSMPNRRRMCTLCLLSSAI